MITVCGLNYNMTGEKDC